MKKSIKTSMIVLFAIIVASILLKAWWFYQDNYIYEPKVKLAVKNFIDTVKVGEYETLSDNSMFTDKTQFNEIKAKILQSDVYSLEIKDWSGNGAYVILKLTDNTAYALMVVPIQEALFSCSGVESKVLTIRE